MEDQLRRRLEDLKKEFEIGQARLKELESEQTYLRETLLRISGAIQVLEEALAQDAKPNDAANALDSPDAEQVSETP
jgi:predicted nuclease with TOPRIM domain